MLNRRSALWSLVVALVGMVSLALPQRAAAQEVRPGAIVGVVVNAAGTPVAEAHVVLWHGDHPVARSLTDRAGRFHFDHVRPGRYVVTAVKHDVGRGRAPVAVRSGEVSRVKITLQR